MYQQPAFREDRQEVLHALIRRYPLGTLVTLGASGLTANLIPFNLAEAASGQTTLRAHLARANDQLEDMRAGAEVLVVFHGPQAYISPSWYPTKHEHGKVVPTWNYVVVQVRGCPRLIDDRDWLLAQIEALTLEQERPFADPWSVGDAPEAFIHAQLKGIVGVEIAIDRIEGKWKASQNQIPVNRAGVIGGLQGLERGCPMAAIVEDLWTAFK